MLFVQRARHTYNNLTARHDAGYKTATGCMHSHYFDGININIMLKWKHCTHSILYLLLLQQQSQK
jgi:hypothetical protein